MEDFSKFEEVPAEEDASQKIEKGVIPAGGLKSKLKKAAAIGAAYVALGGGMVAETHAEDRHDSQKAENIEIDPEQAAMMWLDRIYKMDVSPEKQNLPDAQKKLMRERGAEVVIKDFALRLKLGKFTGKVERMVMTEDEEAAVRALIEARGRWVHQKLKRGEEYDVRNPGMQMLEDLLLQYGPPEKTP